ncbi:MAG: L-2-hydroxyglutarate oxidase [Microcystaceae cyanobacterium]
MYDFTIIGGGIVGLATGMALKERFPDATLTILEKEAKLAFHQTGRNSGVIHSGIYYKPNSFKAKFCRDGNASMVRFCQTHHIPYDQCGKVIVATSDTEIPRLKNLYQRGLDNQLEVSLITKEQVKDYEPYVQCVAGIYVSSTGIADYRKVCQKYAEIIQDKGGEIKLNTRVINIINQPHSQVVETSQETLETRYLINCGGLFSDRIAEKAGVNPQAKIIPFRGEYYELTPEKRYLVKNLIYPVPNPDFPFLGVHFTRMIDGNIHAGPNAVLSFKREGYRKTDVDLKDLFEVISYPGFWKLAFKYADEGIQEMIRSWRKKAFVQSLQQLIPEITEGDVMPSDAGVRAQALNPSGQLVEDFLIIADHNSLHVCNAPSPAATSSLEIGKAIANHPLFDSENRVS